MTTRLAIPLAAALGLLAGAGGCTTENRASIQTQAICIPNATCAFGATCDANYIGYPTLDLTVNATGTLWLFLQVRNQMPANGDPGLGRVNTNDAHIDETRVEYEGAMAGTQSIGSSFSVAADSTAVVSVKLSLAGAVDGEAVAHVRFRGYLDDGTRFESGDFPITIVVCGSGTGSTTGGCAPAACAGGPTCPPDGEGSRPLVCGGA